MRMGIPRERPLQDAPVRRSVAQGRDPGGEWPSRRNKKGPVAVSCAEVYVYPVNRWHRILVRVLVVAQLLSAAPLASASPIDRADAMPCAGMMDMAGMPDMASTPDDTDECPCCPDGAGSMRDCLTSCTLSVAALPATPVLSRAPAPALRVESAPSAPLRSLSDPPLKPPPIR